MQTVSTAWLWQMSPGYLSHWILHLYQYLGRFHKSAETSFSQSFPELRFTVVSMMAWQMRTIVTFEEKRKGKSKDGYRLNQEEAGGRRRVEECQSDAGSIGACLILLLTCWPPLTRMLACFDTCHWKITWGRCASPCGGRDCVSVNMYESLPSSQMNDGQEEKQEKQQLVRDCKDFIRGGIKCTD